MLPITLLRDEPSRMDTNCALGLGWAMRANPGNYAHVDNDGLSDANVDTDGAAMQNKGVRNSQTSGGGHGSRRPHKAKSTEIVWMA